MESKSPQIENGYTATANELLEAECKVKMSGSEWQVYNAIKRMTYGWNKKEDRIAYSQLGALTGLSRNRVYEAVQGLLKRSMILSRENGTHSPQTMGMNKNYKQWKLYRKNGISRENGTRCTEKTVQNYPEKTGPPKKESQLKTTSSPKASPPEALKLAKRLGTHIYKHNPKNRHLQKLTAPKTLNTWGLEIDRAMRIDNRTVKELEQVIDWCQEDSFWQDVILSATKLRDKFDQLWSKSQSAGTQGPIRNEPSYMGDH